MDTIRDVSIRSEGNGSLYYLQIFASQKNKYTEILRYLRFKYCKIFVNFLPLMHKESHCDDETTLILKWSIIDLCDELKETMHYQII